MISKVPTAIRKPCYSMMTRELFEQAHKCRFTLLHLLSTLKRLNGHVLCGAFYSMLDCFIFFFFYLSTFSSPSVGWEKITPAQLTLQLDSSFSLPPSLLLHRNQLRLSYNNQRSRKSSLEKIYRFKVCFNSFSRNNRFSFVSPPPPSLESAPPHARESQCQAIWSFEERKKYFFYYICIYIYISFFNLSGFFLIFYFIKWFLRGDMEISFIIFFIA